MTTNNQLEAIATILTSYGEALSSLQDAMLALTEIIKKQHARSTPPSLELISNQEIVVWHPTATPPGVGGEYQVLRDSEDGVYRDLATWDDGQWCGRYHTEANAVIAWADADLDDWLVEQFR